MQTLLTESGVDPSRILPECNSTNTYENIKFALPFLRLIETKTAIIVTDDYHGSRALIVAKHFGIDAKASCPQTAFPSPFTKPKIQLKEILARQYYRAKLFNARKQDPAL